MSNPLRREIWLAELDPVRGHKKAGTRPCLIVFTDLFNKGASGKVIALPITSDYSP
jgi:mRNA interferase MazF